MGPAPPGTGALWTRTSYCAEREVGRRLRGLDRRTRAPGRSRARRRRRRCSTTSPERRTAAAPEPHATNSSTPASSTTTSSRWRWPCGVPDHRQRVGLLPHLAGSRAGRPTRPTRRRAPPHRPARPRRRARSVAGGAPRLLRPCQPRLGPVGRVGATYAVGRRLTGARGQAGALAQLGPQADVDLLLAAPGAPTSRGSPAGSPATASRARSGATPSSSSPPTRSGQRAAR